nr:hypothetical protein CFP56_33618 [Quercus suber]
MPMLAFRDESLTRLLPYSLIDSCVVPFLENSSCAHPMVSSLHQRLQEYKFCLSALVQDIIECAQPASKISADAHTTVLGLTAISLQLGNSRLLDVSKSLPTPLTSIKRYGKCQPSVASSYHCCRCRSISFKHPCVGNANLHVSRLGIATPEAAVVGSESIADIPVLQHF